MLLSQPLQRREGRLEEVLAAAQYVEGFCRGCGGGPVRGMVKVAPSSCRRGFVCQATSGGAGVNGNWRIFVREMPNAAASTSRQKAEASRGRGSSSADLDVEGPSAVNGGGLLVNAGAGRRSHPATATIVCVWQRVCRGARAGQREHRATTIRSTRPSAPGPTAIPKINMEPMATWFVDGRPCARGHCNGLEAPTQSGR